MRQWTFDPAHSQIQFSVKHLGISTVRGSFGRFTGEISEEDGQVKGVTVDIDVASITTGVEQRDTHLRSSDFFELEKYPTARFAMTSFERDGDEVVATGDLSLRGVTKKVTLKGEVGGPAKDPWGAERVSADLAGKISRKEWGLTWNVALEAGGVMVSDEVKLSIAVEATLVADLVA